MPTLTRRQKEVLDFVKSYQKKHEYSPSLQEIADHIGVSSVSTAHEHLSKLIQKGLVSREENQHRAIEISGNDPMVQIPLLGLISAGQPIEAVQEKESIAFPKSRLPRSGNIFALKVVGDSMVDENINDGDIILVKEQKTANNGQKVVGLIDGYEATVKKYYKERGKIRLEPANKKMKAIVVTKNHKFEIQGIVFDAVRSKAQTKQKKKKQKRSKKYKKLPLNKIIHGDALKKLKKIPNESIDIVIADPPYNIGKDFGNNRDKREISEYVKWSNQWIKECVRSLKPSGTMFIYGFSEILAHLSVEIPNKKRWLVWHYTNKNVASLNFWQRSHESILCVWKNEYVFNRDAIREPYTEGFLNGAAGKVRKGTKGRFSNGGKETIYKAHKNGALPRDVIKIPALAGGAGMKERWFLCKTCDNVFDPCKLKDHKNHNLIKHPTQKPLELSKKLIKSAIPNNKSLVLVPFVGSGSECVAAKILGSNFLGFELNKDYIKIAEKFIEKTKIQDTFIS